MKVQQLKTYFVSHVNPLKEHIHYQLVFAYNEHNAMKNVLETFEDAKFVFYAKRGS